MDDRARGTLARADQGPLAPPPRLDGPLRTVADCVMPWSDIVATPHRDRYRTTEAGGIDFHVGDEELGHNHLDGSIHLATGPTLGRALVADRLARPFLDRPDRGCEQVQGIGPEAAIASFRANHEELARRL